MGQVARRIGANVRRLRRGLGWSHGKLAEEAGLSRSLVWKIEQGAPRTPVAQLQPIATALGVSLDVLARPSGRRSAA